MNAGNYPISFALQTNSRVLPAILADLKVPSAPPSFKRALTFALPVLAALLAFTDESEAE
ncbi:hypothetical protein C7412_102247 [Paraburkholderia silvatlantica]|nr:hypothetical protein C7412_102247 [Paraburkholderia silvatlantica]